MYRQDADDPLTVDHGMTPFQLMGNLKAARDTLGARTSLDGLITGVRLPMPALRVIQQPHHAKFVVSAVPDDVAASFDCESRMAPGGSKKPARVYGKYFGSTFYVDGHQDQPVALLWAQENGYWKIVSWMAGIDADRAPVDTDEIKITHVKAEPGLVTAAHDFLQAWLIRKDYDAAFRFLSPSGYGCYDVLRSPTDPAAASPEDAARRIRAGLERAGQIVGPAKNLDAHSAAADPIHPAVRLMDHGYSADVHPDEPAERHRRCRRVRRARSQRDDPDPAAARLRAGVRPDRAIRSGAATRRCCERCGGTKTARGASEATTSNCRNVTVTPTFYCRGTAAHSEPPATQPPRQRSYVPPQTPRSVTSDGCCWWTVVCGLASGIWECLRGDGGPNMTATGRLARRMSVNSF